MLHFTTPPVRCPACGVPLRLKETRFVGATFRCPECREALVLLQASGEEIELQRASVLKPEKATRPRREWKLPTLSPLVVAWGLAGIVAVVLIGAAWRDHLAAQRIVRRGPPAVPASALPKPEPISLPEPMNDPPISAEVMSEPPVSVAAVLPAAPKPEPPSANVEQPPPEKPAVAAAPVVAAAKADPGVLLHQRLVSFQQTKPASRRVLLQTVEDLMDRPVRLADNLPAELVARLDATLTLTLENATVEDLLVAILRDTGLDFTCTAEAVQLRPR